MAVFRKVMNNPQEMRKNTNKEIGNCLTKGCHFICGYSHMDFRDRSEDSELEVQDSGSKLWRQLSNQVFLNHEQVK